MAREGCAIIIRNNIHHFEEEKYVTCDIQGTNITIATSIKETRSKCNNADQDIISMQISTKHY
jgi:hypothetical protein